MSNSNNEITEEKKKELKYLGEIVNELLKRKLKDDPFYSFISTNEEFGAYDIKHTREVMIYQNELFGTGKLVEAFDNDYPPSTIAQNEIIKLLSEICDSHTGERKRLINVALWHDLGKGILRARHAMEGADFILELDEERRNYLQHNVQIEDQHLILFSDLIRFHDYFGVLATGEASPLLFLDVLFPVSNRSIVSSSSSNFLDLLLLVNTADARAAIKGKMPYEKMEIYLDDLKELLAIHKKLQTTDRRQIGEVLIALKEKSINETQERLRRLLREGVIKFLSTDTCKPESAKLVKQWFTKRDLAEINWALNVSDLTSNFCEQFALTCRLDYGLGFLTALVSKILETCQENGRLNPDKHSSVHTEAKKECAVLLLEILEKLVRRYGELTRNDRRIGLELQFLGKQRQQVADRTKVGTESLINKVLSDKPTKRAEAINKIVNETLAWIL